MQVVPSGPSEQLPAMLRRRPSLALSLGWHGGPGRKGLLGKHRTHTGDLSMLDVFHQRSSLNVFKTIFNSTGHFHKDIIFCLPVYYLKTFQSMPLQSQTAITVIS